MAATLRQAPAGYGSLDTTWTPRRPRWHPLVVRAPSVTGFSYSAVDADAYERLRPGYSAHAVAWLINTAMRVHDGLVADGTGKLTRMLAYAQATLDRVLAAAGIAS